MSIIFNKFPINPVRDANVRHSPSLGHDQVMDLIVREISMAGQAPILVVDGMNGVDFEKFAERLNSAMTPLFSRINWVRASAYVKSPRLLREQFAMNITDNRAFGYMSEGHMSDYFVDQARVECQEAIRSAAGELCVVIGTGSHWLCEGIDSLSIYMDISREAQQVMHKASLLNFGFEHAEDSLEKYKISFFVEWPILEGYRKRNLHKYDLYIDMNQPQKPVALEVNHLLPIIRDIARYPLRVKPFFAPGVWGGQHLKKLADLPSDMVNSAWSFEPIAPENSILIECSGGVIEIPFLLVMDHAHIDILGDRIVRLFGDYFPIRFDYLDTIGGSNLSVQVHPKQTYINKTFNYILEQQESYYMMEKEPDAKVYLGLTEDCTSERFLDSVQHAQQTGQPIDFTDYVQEWDCEKGDLFLIPTGTVHCSGSGNLVLEISATTWWFTFKIYDYVRMGLDGKPRPINIDHAEPNIDWYKKTDWVGDNLIQKPKLAASQGLNEEYVIGKRDDLLFYVNRIHLHDRWEGHTNGEFLMLNLVEGERIALRSLLNPEVKVELGYAESYILPAVFGAYEIVNLSESPCRIVKAGVSPEWDVKVTGE